VLSTGEVDCWGDNSYGELGLGTVGGPDGDGGYSGAYDTPQAVSGITNAVGIDSDGAGYCAVLVTGEVDCWGDNYYGELGIGTMGGPDGYGGYDTPQAVSGITNAVSVASGAYSYCALLSTGQMECWGNNETGELGNGTVGGPDGPYAGGGGYDTPQAVSGLTNVISVANDGDNNYDSYCAVLSSGGVDCWGDNTFGELGNGTMSGPDGADADNYDTPQAVTGITDAVSIDSDGSVNYDSYCAVLSTGGVDCWGDDTYGELGNGTVGGPDSCSSGIWCNNKSGYDSAQEVSGITDAVSVANEAYGYCAVLSTGGVDCWGDNSFGELGNGTIGGPDSCLGYGNATGDHCYDTPQPVSGITSAASIASYDYGDGYCAVLSTGGMDCWGVNEEGELGDGTVGGPDQEFPGGLSGYDTPQAVSGITDAASVASLGNIYCAVLSTGEADCWGDNEEGALGNGTIGGPDGYSGYDSPQVVISP
jgi:alpha-tubulin suppressor-like RCC1 family protein